MEPTVVSPLRERKPNILMIMVDQFRYPTVYDGKELEQWSRVNLKALQFLKAHGIEFIRHYCGTTACVPSRATIFTGQYPSLHGVSQTTGAAKGAFEDDVFWLAQNTVPTLGNYFRMAGYRTFYKGKWHFSYEDILIPGTHEALPSYHPYTGIPDSVKEKLYLRADKLEKYGFRGWIGPEPHGMDPHNSGSSAAIGVSGRDEVYAEEVVGLIRELDRVNREGSKNDEPWLVVASFINPHDISLYGALTTLSPTFKFEVDPSIPLIDLPPTFSESLLTKPGCQFSYGEQYPKAFQPITDNAFYRRLYYQLQKNADDQVSRVLEALVHSSFYENTIVLFTSDHGELLGAHGNLHQKWYCAYEEAIHVPMIVHNPLLFKEPQQVDMLTSHVDIVPTLLGMAGIDREEVQRRLKKSFSEVHPLVGRDLSSLIDGRMPERANEPVYYMTDDDVTRGENQVSFTGRPYRSVIQPNHVETVIAKLTIHGKEQVWKYSRYFDNPHFWSSPWQQDKVTELIPIQSPSGSQRTVTIEITTIKTEPIPDEYEMYNLTEDPLETVNYTHLPFATPLTKEVQLIMSELLKEQSRQKRLAPTSGNTAGVQCY
jgi:arylsulfatase A-like enzyme